VSVDATLEVVVRHDRLVVVTALTAVIALSWAYLLAGAGTGMSAFETTRVAGVTMMSPALWTPGHAVMMFFMWWVMMAAMMLPSATPMILLFAVVNRKQRESGHPHVATSIFAVGYLVAWAGFSLVAVILQWAFERAGILSPMLVGTNLTFGGVLLVAAGVYQLTPIKHACLHRCRSPMAFLGSHWRPGAGGALRMGLVHGAFCVGCCWFLMGLLFFGGVMNLYWIAGIALFVLLEKTVSAGHWFGYATGVALFVWGGVVLVPAFWTFIAPTFIL
jgi:predicted metal-binding membrane protein